MATRKNTMNRAADWHAEVATDDDETDDEVPGNEIAPLGAPAVEPEEDDSPTARVQKFLQASNGYDRATLQIYRLTGPKAHSFCREISPHDFEGYGLTGIRDEWGPGEYELRLYGTHPIKKNFGLLARVTERISAPLPNAKTAVLPGDPAGSSDLAVALRTIAEGQSRILDALVNRQQEDPMSKLKEMVALAGMVRELGGGGAEKGGVKEVLENLTLLKQLQGKDEGGGGEANLFSLGAGLLDVLKTQMQHPPQPVAPTMPALPPIQLPPSLQEPPAEPIPTGEVTETEPEGDAMQFFMLSKLRGVAAVLKQQAAKGDAPEVIDDAANFALDELPEEIIDAMRQPEWFAALSVVMPDAAKFKPWLEKVRQAMLEMLAEDEAGPPSMDTGPSPMDGVTK